MAIARQVAADLSVVFAHHAGADLETHNTLNMCYAGYHYDLNFLTIHGKSRFPGLFVWLRDGRRVAVKIPAGCLLLQAGKQLEWLTGGYVMAGMHEVSPGTLTHPHWKRRKKCLYKPGLLL